MPITDCFPNQVNKFVSKPEIIRIDRLANFETGCFLHQKPRNLKVYNKYVLQQYRCAVHVRQSVFRGGSRRVTLFIGRYR